MDQDSNIIGKNQKTNKILLYLISKKSKIEYA